jgi:hypothetical protein
MRNLAKDHSILFFRRIMAHVAFGGPCPFGGLCALLNEKKGQGQDENNKNESNVKCKR